jgi:two-component system, OmpR family, sensor kinase
VTRRRALAVFAAAAALLLASNVLVYSLYRSEVNAIASTLDERLAALGTTEARWLAITNQDTVAGALVELVADNRLEDAYLLDGGLHVVGGARTRAGSLNLLRVDEKRVLAALEGKPSVGDGYSIANTQVEVAYFPVARDGKPYVLALEAGAEFHEPAAALRTTYLLSVAMTVLVAVLFGVGLGLALRALERARVAHGRAERLAAVGQMAAMVAHEVRNPLGILRGQVELLRERLAGAAAAREQERFAEMLAEIERLNALTEEFLDLARDAPLELARVELGELARSIADDARIAARSPSKLEVVADPDVSVSVDSNKLRRAIHNLVLNSLQVGGLDVAVTIEVASVGQRARLTVADDGPGVPAALAGSLFEPFVSAREGGSGLGLAVARRVVERHGGSLVLESTPGSPGARFSIYLPREGS